MGGKWNSAFRLDQHCMLCAAKPVGYVKLKGGFAKVCRSCAEVLEKADLTVEPDQVFAQ